MRCLVAMLLFPLMLFAQESIYKTNLQTLDNCISCRPKEKVTNPVAEWMDKDIQHIHEMLNKAQGLLPTMDNYLKIFPSLLSANGNVSTERVLLPDQLEYIKHEVYGGYVSIYINVLVFEGGILYSEISIDADNDIFRDHYLKEITVPLQCSGNMMQWSRIYDDNVLLYRKEHPHFLWELEINRRYEPRELTIFYNMNTPQYLSKNRDIYHVDGDYAHFAELNLKYLLEKKKYGVIEKLLFSVNPIGRMYACAALDSAILTKSYKPNNKLQMQMSKIREGGMQFDSGIISCWVNKFEYDHHDLIKNNPFLP
ncbi:hypothetical protein HYN59_03635 [Flavobacterium album]|uniref:Uncharacterized protein n=1 Tax=Flavobacterium album TaxID=2175091 RepID=A0A2S1QV83_9FLAO|nr:hypothetical protein [Flavobacterium album]AWH84259.1 hypothetical protein HYN59_03635 [Flavobacterium album]